jgi:N-acetylglutamate synthase-like GNAT family acetyltransferase
VSAARLTADPSLLDAGEPTILVDCPAGATVASGVALARQIGARRLMFVVRELPEALADRLHFLVPEARARLGPDTPGRIRLLVEAAANGLPVVLLSAGAGCVFEELFTHHGAGVLIGDPQAEVIRVAQADDAADIFLLLRGDMERGTVRRVDEGEVARSASDHLVYTIDDIVVGTARLAPHGQWAELSRFATLPRYRGRGRARELGLALITWARARGFSDLFALSVDARMWAFFESLGFVATPREALPASWQAGYDFDRPSRAFHRPTEATPEDEPG